VSAPAPAAPRPRLDRETIVRTVLEIGVARFSMHAVARRLGVSATALYRYFPSRETLLAAVMDVFCERLEPPDPDLPWPEYLSRLAHAFRRTLLRMPGAADYATAIGPATPSAFAIVEEALGVLRAAGFGPEAAWRAYTLVVNHAFRAVQGQEQFAALQERTGPGAFRLFQLSEAERRRYPEVARVGASLRFDFDESFARSLACIVAGLEVQRARGAL